MRKLDPDSDSHTVTAYIAGIRASLSQVFISKKSYHPISNAIAPGKKLEYPPFRTLLTKFALVLHGGGGMCKPCRAFMVKYISRTFARMDNYVEAYAYYPTTEQETK